MIANLQKIGDSKGIVIDDSILDLLNIKQDSAFEVTHMAGGIYLKPLTVEQVYMKVSSKHRKSLDKLAEC
jgi:antitoxin component of MazEF toxin-antitoxin module